MSENKEQKKPLKEVIKENRFYLHLKRVKKELEAKEQILIDRENYLHKMEADLRTRSQKLAEKEKAVEQEKSELDQIRGMLRQQTQLAESSKSRSLDAIRQTERQIDEFKEKNKIPKEVAKEQVIANKYITNKFVKMTQELEEFKTKMNSIDNMSPEEINKFRMEYARLKGRFYGMLAVLQEVKTPNEINQITMGDEKTTLGNVIKDLPNTLPLPDHSHEERFECAKYICAEYRDCIDDLNDLGFYKGQSRDRIDYDFTRGTGLVNDGACWILNNYFDGDFILNNRTFESFHPLRNFRKIQQPTEIRINPENKELESMLDEIGAVDKEMAKTYQKK